MKKINLILLVLVCFSLAACPAKKANSQEETTKKVSVETDGKIKHLTDTDFDAFVKEKTVVVDFYADWCPPCRAFSPAFEEVAKNNTSVYFVKVNVDKAPVTSNTYNVQFIPFVVLLENGKIVDQFSSNDRSAEGFQKWVSNIK